MKKILFFVFTVFFIANVFFVSAAYDQTRINEIQEGVRVHSISISELNKAFDDGCITEGERMAYIIQSRRTEAEKVFFQNLEKSKIFMGFYNEKGVAVGTDHFMVGLFAGIYLWLFIRLRMLYNYVLDKDIFKFIKKEEYNLLDSKTRWVYLIAGSFWKVICIGAVYSVFAGIPIVSTFLYYVNLEFLTTNFFVKSFILAFEIGFGPYILESYLRSRKETLQMRKLHSASKMAAQEGRR